MNIDELKDAWNNDEPQGMQIPGDTQTLGKTNSMIGKVRSNMRTEFIATIFSYPLLLVYLVFSHRPSFFFNMACIFFFTIFILNAYFYARFYRFYRSIARYDLSIKEGIRKIAYELELNTEIYLPFFAVMMFRSIFCWY